MKEGGEIPGVSHSGAGLPRGSPTAVPVSLLLWELDRYLRILSSWPLVCAHLPVADGRGAFAKLWFFVLRWDSLHTCDQTDRVKLACFSLYPLRPLPFPECLCIASNTAGREKQRAGQPAIATLALGCGFGECLIQGKGEFLGTSQLSEWLQGQELSRRWFLG